jgi:hypothetical protein
MRVLFPSGQIRRLRCFIRCTNQRQKRVQAGGSACSAAAQRSPPGPRELNPAQHDPGTLAPDFLPLGIGLFKINTRDVVMYEDAPKAFVTNFISIRFRQYLLLIKQAFGRSCSNSKTTGIHSLSQTGSRRVDPIYRSPIPFLNFNSSSESLSSLDVFDKD